jgi:V/A-type H+-transporting ATPase subunit I
MKKIKLIALRSQKDELLRELMLLGCVQVSEPEDLLANPEITAIAARETSELELYRANRANLLRAVEILGQYAPAKSPMFPARPDIPAERFLNESELDKYLSLAATLESRDSRIRRINAEETREYTLIASLLPWETMQLPFDHEGTATSGVLIGSVPPGADLSALDRALSDAAPESQLFEVSSDKDQTCVTVVYLREAQAAVGEVLREWGFSASTLKSLHGTAREQIAAAKTRIAEMRDERDGLTTQLVLDASSREDLLQYAELAGTQVARAEAAERLVATSSSVTLLGWVTAPSEKSLSATLTKYVCAWELSDPEPDEFPNVPVQLKNNFLTRPLMMVTEMYSLPAYDGVDPNPLMAPFFILFYGIMMADMGYGLLMALGALFVKTKKPRGGTANFVNLLLLCGIATFAVGILTGGFFGDFLLQVAGMLGYTFKLPYQPPIDPMRDTTMLLYASIALGALHIMVGMAISFIKQTKDGHFLDALFDIGSWWLLFAGIGLGALGITWSWYVAAAGALALILTQGRGSAKLLGKFVGGIASLYNITGYFGDVLSYARLMALMLAGGAVATAFNQIGAITGNVFTFVLIAAVGNALNLGLNLIGCYVHDLRLQCLEYMGKFYKDGGRQFSPLTIDSKNYNIVK